jgi:hypothetical protein
VPRRNEINYTKDSHVNLCHDTVHNYYMFCFGVKSVICKLRQFKFMHSLLSSFYFWNDYCGRNSVAERSEAAYVALQNTHRFRLLRYWCHRFDPLSKHGCVTTCLPLFCFPLYTRDLPTRRSPVKRVLSDVWSFTSERKREKRLTHDSWRFKY